MNFALDCAAQDTPTILADLDLANPYFVSRDTWETLERHHIRLLAPNNVLAFGDVPNLPPSIIGIVRQNLNTVIDLAGDKAGALVLGYLAKFINPADFYIYLVINPYRPFSQELYDIVVLRQMLEQSAGHLISGIISNPHLVEETDFKIIQAGHRSVEVFAREIGIPITSLIVTEPFYQMAYEEFGSIVKKIHLYLRPDWL